MSSKPIPSSYATFIHEGGKNYRLAYTLFPLFRNEKPT
jgi:hypothetical protein